MGSNPRPRVMLAGLHSNLASYYMSRGQDARAKSRLDQAWEIQRDVLKQHPQNQTARTFMGIHYSLMVEVCRRLKKDTTLPLIPIILVTAKGSSEDVVAGLEAGADEYLTKPIDQAALVARVHSMLRIKALHDQV